MAKQTINIGSSANDGTGDPLRTAFDKINDNFTELYSAGAAGTNLDLTGNSITSVDTNGNITLDPNGTGKVVVNTGNEGQRLDNFLMSVITLLLVIISSANGLPNFASITFLPDCLSNMLNKSLVIPFPSGESAEIALIGLGLFISSIYFASCSDNLLRSTPCFFAAST